MESCVERGYSLGGLNPLVLLWSLLGPTENKQKTIVLLTNKWLINFAFLGERRPLSAARLRRGARGGPELALGRAISYTTTTTQRGWRIEVALAHF